MTFMNCEEKKSKCLSIFLKRPAASNLVCIIWHNQQTSHRIAMNIGTSAATLHPFIFPQCTSCQQQFQSMSFGLHKRSCSIGTLARLTLKQLKTRKQQQLAERGLQKLKQMRTCYQKPFGRREVKQQQEREEPQVRVLSKAKPVNEDFQGRCRKLCEQLCFCLQIFERLYKQNYRKKSVLVRFYGWDGEFEQIFFHKHREDLRADLSPETLFARLNFSTQNQETRNTFNKLRLFASEVLANNRRQQQLQSKFMKLRLQSQLGKLDREVGDIARDSSRKDLRFHLEEIGRTHDHMLNTKIKIHNKMEALNRIQQHTGRVNIRDYYGIEEGDIDDVEKYFTSLRLQKRH